jgi:hypothetical protein
MASQVLFAESKIANNILQNFYFKIEIENLMVKRIKYNNNKYIMCIISFNRDLNEIFLKFIINCVCFL